MCWGENYLRRGRFLRETRGGASWKETLITSILGGVKRRDNALYDLANRREVKAFTAGISRHGSRPSKMYMTLPAQNDDPKPTDGQPRNPHTNLSPTTNQRLNRSTAYKRHLRYLDTLRRQYPLMSICVPKSQLTKHSCYLRTKAYVYVHKNQCNAQLERGLPERCFMRKHSHELIRRLSKLARRL